MDFPAGEVSDALQCAVRSLDEREEMEPFVRDILADSSDTPHGPAEIADIMTHKLTIKESAALAAFILKGKSFRVVRPKDVSHQIYRLEKISGLRLAVFAASGTILDAAKEQFVSTADRLGIRYCILDTIDLSRLFVAYGFLCPRDGQRIMAGRCKCGYSPARRILNVFQRESVKELKHAHSLDQRAGLIVLPTGTGKTRIAARDARSFGAKSVLYVAHTHEILDVAQSEFEAVFGTKEVTRHCDQTTLKSPRMVNLVTIQLIRNNMKALRCRDYDYVIVDEFHHAAAPSYRQLLSHLAPDFLLGLTATPFRGDRQDIAELCDGNILVQFELRSGIDTGVLSTYHYFGCFDDIDYSKLKHRLSNYSIRDLEKALIIPERDAAIARKWRERAENKPTLAFCCSHRHAHRMSESLNENGIPSAVYLSDTDMIQRKNLIDKLQHGEVRILCTVDVLNEGADMPFVECLMFLRPTESKRIFFQQHGRGLRKCVGKSHCVVIDFIGNFKNAYRIVEYHGLLPYPEDEPASSLSSVQTAKEVLNLPLSCEVHFEDKVIEIFAEQTLDPRHATRHNIGRIMIYQYKRLTRSLGHRPTKKEVDRYALLSSKFYSQVFGSWTRFEELAR
jgi:superfamily II DNA or RNA helicase